MSEKKSLPKCVILPEGQTPISSFPVYDIKSPRPTIEYDAFELVLSGSLLNPLTLRWKDILTLPFEEVVADFHCVTGWSKLDCRWGGVRAQRLLELIEPGDEVIQVMAVCYDGYSTNIPLQYFFNKGSMLATHLDGSILSYEHGGPLRLVIPSLYGWKSAKYVHILDFQTEIKSGYWEQRGYHLIGDPWKEERFNSPVHTKLYRWKELKSMI